jgi:hypothetical protein
MAKHKIDPQAGVNTRFKPGQSGNPNGRPKKLPEIDILLADILGDEQNGISAAEAILMKMRAKATGGDIRAAELLLDRAYGKVPTKLATDGLAEGMLSINYVLPGASKPKAKKKKSQKRK